MTPESSEKIDRAGGWMWAIANECPLHEASTGTLELIITTSWDIKGRHVTLNDSLLYAIIRLQNSKVELTEMKGNIFSCF